MMLEEERIEREAEILVRAFRAEERDFNSKLRTFRQSLGYLGDELKRIPKLEKGLPKEELKRRLEEHQRLCEKLDRELEELIQLGEIAADRGQTLLSKYPKVAILHDLDITYFRLLKKCQELLLTRWTIVRYHKELLELKRLL